MATLKPGDADLTDQVSGFQAAYTHRPDLVAAVTSAEDVRAAVAYAAAERLPVAPWRDAGPVLLENVREMPYAEGGTIYSDPDFPHSFYGSNAMPATLGEIQLRRVVQPAGPNSRLPLVGDLRQLFDVVRDETLGRAISFRYGISTPSEHAAEIWPPEMRARLASIKAEWDPENLFRAGPAVA